MPNFSNYLVFKQKKLCVNFALSGQQHQLTLDNGSGGGSTNNQRINQGGGEVEHGQGRDQEGGIEESRGIDVYPNPSRGEFTFRNLEEGSELEVYDYTGKRVWRVVTREETTTIDISEMVRGIYFYQVKVKAETFTGKLMKQ